MAHITFSRNGVLFISVALAASFGMMSLATSGESKDALTFIATSDDSHSAVDRALKRLKLEGPVSNGCQSNGSAQVGNLANPCANRSYSVPAMLVAPRNNWFFNVTELRSIPLMTTATVILQGCSYQSGLTGISLSSGQTKWTRPDICPSEAPWLNEAREVGLIVRAERAKADTGEWRVAQLAPTPRMIYLDADTGKTTREFPLEMRSQEEIAKGAKARNPTTYPRDLANVLEAGQVLLVPDLDAGRVTAVSAKDGRWLWAYALFANDGKRVLGACLSYLSVSRGVLLASAGTSSPLGGKIFALDLATGRELWTKPIATCGTKLAVFDDKAVLITSDKSGRQGISGREPWEYRVMVANLKTGTPIWRSDAVGSEANPPQGWNGKYLTQSLELRVVSEQGVVVRYSNNLKSTLLSYDLNSGDLRWARPGDTFPLFATGGTIVARSTTPARIVALDANAGTLLWELPAGEGASQLPKGIGTFSPAPDGSWAGLTPEGVVRLK